MASITITSTGLGASISGLESLRKASRQPMMKLLGTEQVANINDRVDRRKSHTDATYPASKRALREGGTTLRDKGHMMTAMRASAWTDSSVTVGFKSDEAAQKAVWAQEGTKAHRIAATGNALFWKTKYKTAFKLTKSGKPSTVTSKHFAKYVDHPGTPKRPFFGISPSDITKLTEKANAEFLRIVERSGLKHG